MLDRLSKQADDDAESNIGPGGVAVEIVREWERVRDDGQGKRRRRILRQHEAQLEGFEWTVPNLEKIGIPPAKVPGLLSEFQTLEIRRYSNVRTTRGTVSGVNVFVRDFDGFERYLWILSTVILMMRFADAEDLGERVPYKPWASAAAGIYARGIIDSDIALIDAGEDIVRFQLWRDEKVYNDNYAEAQKKYIRTPEGHTKHMMLVWDFIEGERNE